MAEIKKNYTLPIIVMFFLFMMISFVTGFQNPFGIILKEQLKLTTFQSQLGAAANFIAYAIMGIPAGILLQRKGYKFSAISAVLVGLAGVALMFISSFFTAQTLVFSIYLAGALVAGFSMCMLNTVVNPMLNTLGGGGKTGNRLIQFGGTCNSLAATICPIFVGFLIGNNLQGVTMITARPALYIAAGIFLLALIVLYFSKLPEPILDELKEKEKNGDAGKAEPTLGEVLKFRHFVLGAVGIFLYLGIEIGIPQIANVYMTSPTLESATKIVNGYEADHPELQKTQPASQVSASAIEDAIAGNGSEALENPVTAEEINTIAGEEITSEEYESASNIVSGKIKPGLGIAAEIAGALCGMYWLMMLIGRLLGGVLGGKISSRVMLATVASAAIVFLLLAILTDTSNLIKVPGVSSDLSFRMYDVPVNILFFVLCGLCTSVMWGGIFNLAVEGLGKYTAVASGFFMVMVCGGGIILPFQAYLADAFGYLSSYWVLVACAAYLLYYALAGSKVSKKDMNISK